MIAVSVIIVNYNTKELIRNCLKSLFEQTKGISFEVIVSDNGSVDGSQEMIKTTFPSVILVENKENVGFGTANNRALNHASGKYIFYLNSDTVLLNNAVKCFFDYWEAFQDKGQLGALGCFLVDEDGSPAPAGGNFPSYLHICHEAFAFLYNDIFKTVRLYRLVRKLKKCFTKQTETTHKEQTERNVDFVCGADLFVLNDKNAFFDETYFLYYEETDLQFRMAQTGLYARLIGSPQIIHLQGGSDSNARIAPFSQIQRQISSLYYSRKNLHKTGGILRLLILLDWANPLLWEKVRPYRKNLRNTHRECQK